MTEDSMEMCAYVRENLPRILNRTCRCGNIPEIIYKNVKCGTTLLRNVPYRRCRSCRTDKEIHLVMLAAHTYIKTCRMKAVDCRSLFGLKK